MKTKIYEILGWYGMVAIVGAYALTSFGIVEVENLFYRFLNFSGAVGIVLISLQKKAYQPAVLNIIWTIIAFAAILSIIF